MINKRFEEYRLKKGLKVKELADIIGISQGSLSDIKNERTDPKAETIEKFALNTDVNPVWLITGKGPMTINKQHQIVAESKPDYYYYDASVCKVHPICQEICKFCQETPDDLKQEILEYIQFKQSLKPKRSTTGAKRGRRSA